MQEAQLADWGGEDEMNNIDEVDYFLPGETGVDLIAVMISLQTSYSIL